MGQGYLLDTNICLYFLNQVLTSGGFGLVSTAIDQGEVALSVVSQIELLGFAFPSQSEQIITEQFVADMPILSLTDTIVQQIIAIRRKHKIKLPDAMIAATAIEHGFTLVTRNIADFKSIANLALIDPFEL